MDRASFVLRIAPEHYDEYVERHRFVYPELLDAFRRAGIRTYSIFYHEGLLFAYMEADDFEQAMEQLKHEPSNRMWQQMMSDMLLQWENGATTRTIPEVFHFENTL